MSELKDCGDEFFKAVCNWWNGNRCVYKHFCSAKREKKDLKVPIESESNRD